VSQFIQHTCKASSLGGLGGIEDRAPVSCHGRRCLLRGCLGRRWLGTCQHWPHHLESSCVEICPSCGSSSGPNILPVINVLPAVGVLQFAYVLQIPVICKQHITVRVRYGRYITAVSEPVVPNMRFPCTVNVLTKLDKKKRQISALGITTFND
jgi:hypothetical protein